MGCRCYWRGSLLDFLARHLGIACRLRSEEFDLAAKSGRRDLNTMAIRSQPRPLLTAIAFVAVVFWSRKPCESGRPA